MNDIDRLIAEHSGIALDIGCGANKQPGHVGLDIRALPGVDIVHDINDIPWPLPDGCVRAAFASHLVEHIPPHNFGFVNFMNEVWRIMQVEGQFAISTPHGRSYGFLQDPTHTNPCVEATWQYFCPLMQDAYTHQVSETMLYYIYEPHPWLGMIVASDPAYNMEVILRKLPEDWRDRLARNNEQ